MSSSLHALRISFPFEVLGMDLQSDQVECHSRSRLKIRRAPSCKISASLYGSCSQKKKKGSNGIVIQPLIFHTVDPKIITTEPAEFMRVVQRLTGSPNTRRLVSALMRGSKEVHLCLQVQDVQLMQQGMHSMHQISNNDPLKERTAEVIAPTTAVIAPTNVINPNLRTIKDLPPTPSSPNPSDLPLSSAISTPASLVPLSAKSTNDQYLSTNHLASSPLSAKASDKFSNIRGPPCSPLSPSSSLTTTSEGCYHTDYLSTEDGASPYTEAVQWFEQGNTGEAEEDGSIDFFDYSLDSYYGNYIH